MKLVTLEQYVCIRTHLHLISFHHSPSLPPFLHIFLPAYLINFPPSHTPFLILPSLPSFPYSLPLHHPFLQSILPSLLASILLPSSSALSIAFYPSPSHSDINGFSILCKMGEVGKGRISCPSAQQARATAPRQE